MLTTSCHCGGVRIELSRAPRKLTQCNCSICRRYGALWAYFKRRDVRFLSPRAMLQFYSWGRRDLRFGRCRRCGCLMHWEPTLRRRSAMDRLGLNLRNAAAPETVARLPIRMLDGASTWKVLRERAQPDLLRSPRSR